ncbi:MAG: hypothetical protein Kow00109_27210 [Acidobacteriota bacterium]
MFWSRVRTFPNALAVAATIFAATTVLLPQDTSDVVIEAHSLRRSELPDDIPPQIFDGKFAVVKIRIVNHSGDLLELKTEDFEVRGPDGKVIPSAPLTDIVPHLVKFFRPTQSTVHGELGYWPKYPQVAHWEQGEKGGDRAGTVDANTAPRLRATLEKYQLNDYVLSPGETVDALIYLESKKSGAALRGGKVLWYDREIPLQ